MPPRHVFPWLSTNHKSSTSSHTKQRHLHMLHFDFEFQQIITNLHIDMSWLKINKCFFPKYQTRSHEGSLSCINTEWAWPSSGCFQADMCENALQLWHTSFISLCSCQLLQVHYPSAVGDESRASGWQEFSAGHSSIVSDVWVSGLESGSWNIH